MFLYILELNLEHLSILLTVGRQKESHKIKPLVWQQNHEAQTISLTSSSY